MSDSSHEHAGHKTHGGGDMGMRGVARPMAEHHANDHHEQKQHHQMSHDDRMMMLKMHHKQTLWIYWTLVILGLWMMLAPFTFGYDKALVQPSGGRSVWLSLDARVSAMIWSDVISGVLLLLFGWRSLTPNRPKSLWACCFVGIWISMAPLVVWAPTAAAYLNDTIVGVLVIALSVLIPGMPNMIMYMKMGPTMPPGWSYNPSSWPQRWIMIALGFAGWVVSRYLAAFQLGFIDRVWEPFFGTGTRNVLNSNMSHMWPISDAGLGTFSYTFEFLMGWMGSPARWRTMPWMVTFFGILVIPLGLVHIILVISQPVVVGSWCTLCLLAAAIMLPMIPLEVDEVIAMGQYLVHARRKGESMWKAFWMGGGMEGDGRDERSPELMDFPRKPFAIFNASLWGMSFPATLVISTVLGVWLVFGPSVFGSAKPVSHIEHLAGLLLIVVSIISMGEVLRGGRYLNVVIGLGVAVLPWFFDGGTTGGRVNDLIVGLAVAALAIPRGMVRESFGEWDRFIK